MTDPQYSDAVIREQQAHNHDPATCPECKELLTAKHERQQQHAPRDRSLKHPRRDR